jgi:Spy/CpxP family protein refolding chaperone
MKGYKVLPVVLFLFGATAQAQQRSPNPPAQQGQQGQQGQQTDDERRARLRDAVSQQEAALQAALAAQTAFGIQVGGGGAWWTNANLVQRLGITDEQKAKLDRAFENHRPKLESSKDLLEKEEAQLAKLLDADTVDRNAVLSQIDRVIQARGEMERANSAMTLEMREVLTRAQWNQVPQPSISTGNTLTRFTGTVSLPSPSTAPAGRGAPGQRTGGPRGGGQRTGGPATQPPAPGQRQDQQ